MSKSQSLPYTNSAHRFNGKALMESMVNQTATLKGHGKSAHHSRFHSPDCFIFGVMGNIRGGVEHVVDTVSSVSADHCAVIGSCDRFTTPKSAVGNVCHEGN